MFITGETVGLAEWIIDDTFFVIISSTWTTLQVDQHDDNTKSATRIQ